MLLAGYQAQGTRGRRLVEGATELKIHGRYALVRAEVVNLPSFSAHADADELVEWAERKRLHDIGWTAVLPNDGERVLI